MRRSFILLGIVLTAASFVFADSVPLCVSGLQSAGTTCSTGALTLSFTYATDVVIDSSNQLSFFMGNNADKSLHFTVSAEQPIYWISSTVTGEFFQGGGTVGSSAGLGGQFLTNNILRFSGGSEGPQIKFLDFQEALTGTGILEVFTRDVVYSYIYCGEHPEIQCNGIATGSATFEFGLNPTPEPSSLMMLFVGLALIGTGMVRAKLTSVQSA